MANISIKELELDNLKFVHLSSLTQKIIFGGACTAKIKTEEGTATLTGRDCRRYLKNKGLL